MQYPRKKGLLNLVTPISPVLGPSQPSLTDWTLHMCRVPPGTQDDPGGLEKGKSPGWVRVLASGLSCTGCDLLRASFSISQVTCGFDP